MMVRVVMMVRIMMVRIMMVGRIVMGVVGVRRVIDRVVVRNIGTVRKSGG